MSASLHRAVQRLRAPDRVAAELSAAEGVARAPLQELAADRVEALIEERVAAPARRADGVEHDAVGLVWEELQIAVRPVGPVGDPVDEDAVT